MLLKLVKSGEKMMPVAIADGDHKRCFACGQKNSHGLKLHFAIEADGSVASEFFCDETFQSYDGTLHGGIIATVLDSAMTNCLFINCVKARTARLNIRYYAPVHTNERARVVTFLKRKLKNAYLLIARFFQGERLCAEAQAVFIRMAEGGRA
ncbi:MAG: hotdog domain-containing protein [Candidatus Eremiobacteraeota bacterium]|nr:hotdog domain-containing protein [Candidatus Eremiobacteraeota bacterium]